jgi:hypothetical protein
VTKGNGVRDCQLGTVRFRSTTCDRTQPEAYLRSYSINTAFKCIYSLIIRQPPIYNAAGCLCCSSNKWLPAAMLPILLASNKCSRLPMLQQAPYAAAANMWRYRTAGGSLPTCGCNAACYTTSRLPLCCSLCCRLPTVAIPHCKWLPTAMLLLSTAVAPSMLHRCCLP